MSKTNNFRRLLGRFLLLFLILQSLLSFSQSEQVIGANYASTKSEKNNLASEFKVIHPDTSILEQANYLPRNFLGNIGLASPDFALAFRSEDLGFRFFQPPTRQDRFTEQHVSYYRSRGPYANLTGVAGAKELQIFKMLFTHTYRDRVNISVNFQRYTSTGFYQRQQTYTNNLFITSNYETKKGRFGYYFFVLNNSNKNAENGGIKAGKLNDSTMNINKELLPYNISNANRDNRETRIAINPYFRLNKRSDSAHTLNHFIQLKSKFVVQTFEYNDNGIANDGFYPVAYHDTAITHDSSNVKQFANEVAYTLQSRDKKNVFSLGAKNEINSVWQKADSVFSNNIALVDWVIRRSLNTKDTLNPKRDLENHLNAQYVLQGPNTGNYLVQLNSILEINESKKRNLELKIAYEERSADYIYNYWVSNHFQWFNLNFKPQQQLQIDLKFNLGYGFQIGAYQQSISNYLYFNQAQLPDQFKGTINNTALSLNYSRIFFHHLGFSINHLYQLSSNAEYIRIPQNASTIKLFYHAFLFKNNLQLNIGSQLQVYEAYTPYNYMPATQVFYLQEQSKTDLYPYVDFFINIRIHPVSFFLKIENALKGFAGPNYYLIPGYYQTDRAFRFGLSWTFFD